MEGFQQTINRLNLVVTEESREDLLKEMIQYANPLGSKNIKFKNQNLGEERHLLPFGGGGQVGGVGQTTELGGSVAGTSINVNVSGQATVRIEMWMPLGSIPMGSWTVSGPAQTSIFLGCTLGGGCAAPTGQLCTIKAVGINGTFPVWVSYNP